MAEPGNLAGKGVAFETDLDRVVVQVVGLQRLLMGEEHGPHLPEATEGDRRLSGDGRLAFTPPEYARRDTFVYDPANPVPSLGGQACCTGTDTEAGAYDQRRIEQREDVLVYTSAPFL